MMSMTAALRQHGRTTGRGTQAAAMQPRMMTLSLIQMTYRQAVLLRQRMVMRARARLQMAEGRVALLPHLPLCAAYSGFTAQPRHMPCRRSCAG